MFKLSINIIKSLYIAHAVLMVVVSKVTSGNFFLGTLWQIAANCYKLYNRGGRI